MCPNRKPEAILHFAQNCAETSHAFRLAISPREAAWKLAVTCPVPFPPLVPCGNVADGKEMRPRSRAMPHEMRPCLPVYRVTATSLTACVWLRIGRLPGQAGKHFLAFRTLQALFESFPGRFIQSQFGH